MTVAEKAKSDRQLNERLAGSGFRFTPQREHVYHVLLERRDHPTADEVYLRSKRRRPEISMATVYNCLDALVKSGLVRHVRLGGGAARYCPNMSDHGHFLCESCGGIFDLDLGAGSRPPVALPEGFTQHEIVVSVKGCCPECAHKPRRRGAAR
jgi:Fur family peroxide stress response transcriptional regulator